MVGIAICQFGRASGSPSDIFTSAAPVIGADPPKAAELRAGDASVSTQTGALQYSYPIQVPPGRNGMAPSLALTYSSQAPIYGGIAAGWSLPLGMIRQDTSHGRIAPGTQDRFLVGESRLVEVTEPHAADVSKTYRIANGDSSFTRYERLIPGATARWRARATDGSVSLFGESAFTTGCTNLADGFAPLTRTIDVFGNEVVYFYEQVINKECRIQKIEWGKNSNAGINNPFAKVVFTWQAGTQCNGATEFHVGGQHDYRTGKLIRTGASRLTTITATAFAPSSPNSPVHTRTITLGYDAADEARCGETGHASFRRLASIQESASGTDSPLVTLPAVTFDYGDPTIDLATTGGTSTPWIDTHPDFDPQQQNLGWGIRRNDDRWPTVEAMLLDIDGDGLLDRVMNASKAGQSGTCLATWLRNNGVQGGQVQTFGAPLPGMSSVIALPRLKWRGSVTPYPAAGATTADTNEQQLNKEGCSLNGQVTAFENSNPASICHASEQTCQNGSEPQNHGPYCYPNGTECVGLGNLPSPFRTYLAYRWLDMDADGLVDLVAAVHGNVNAYDIERGNRTGYNNGEPDLFGPWPACPQADGDTCKDVSAACISAAKSCSPGVQCTVNQAAVDACMASAEQIGCHELIGIPYMLPPGNPTTDPRKPYTRCEGLYPWFIYKNLGKGSFATAPVIKYQPVPLESNQGDSSIGGTRLVAERHAIMDFDGDGILDAVASPKPEDDAPGFWFVWSGDGTGGFTGPLHMFQTRANTDDANAISLHRANASGQIVESAGVFDINGDGLSDQWARNAANNNANVAFHLGAQGFELFGTPSLGAIDTPAVPPLVPGNETTKTITLPNPWTGQPIIEGSTSMLTRTIDVDNDGRLDIVRWGTPPKVHFNFGGQFRAQPSDYLTNTGGLQRSTVAVNSAPLRWELDGDLIDLDGDGIAESVYFDINGFKRFTRVIPTDGAPPRLLQAIHNGRGGHARIGYAQMHDTSAVVQESDATWFDGRPKATPRAQWVVKSIRNIDDFSATDSTTSYRYLRPRHGSDDEGRFAFRGFEQVEATAPNGPSGPGMTTIQRYDYATDWSGRLSETLVVPGETSSDVRSISKTKWTGRTLFSNAVTTFHPTLVETFTCSNGQNEAGCLATPAGYTRSESTLTDFPLIGTKLLVLETGKLLKNQVASADGDRQTISTFAINADSTNYRVRPLTSTKEHRVSGAMVMFAKSAQDWDPTLAVPLTNETWVDSNDSNRAKTRTVYDMTTGNVIERWKPVQNDAGTTKTSFSYDSRKLFPITEVNELGHERNFLWEYGTGTKLQTDGPNVRTCTGSCTGLLKERTKIRVDGLGRTIELSETFSDAGDTFNSRIKETTSYVDAVVVPTTPSSSTHQVRLTTSATPATMVKTELDGHGRPTKRTEFTQGTAAADNITTWQYASDGTLSSLTVPHPGGFGSVSYTYGFDSLGRATSVRRPDAVGANRSGVDVFYDGLTKTVTEFVGAAGGTPASTKTVTDAFGRLVQVHERTAISPLTFAVTDYTFGPDDNVTLIVAPQSVTTQLVHDFAGRRTQINRHGRSWKYVYDKNGNLKSEQVPGAPLGQELLYTTTIDYDDLDRPISKVIGQRGIPAADQALFAAGSETFTYDVGGNMVGRLRSWKTFAPGSPTPAITRDRLTDDQGFDTRAEHIYSGAAGFSNNVFTTMKHNVGGLATETKYSEGHATTTQSTSTILYTARGLPLRIDFAVPGVSTKQIAVQTRNVPGLVSSSVTNLTTGNVTSNWSYDALGRVISQAVSKSSPSTSIVSQTISYLGNDNPNTLTHTLGASSKQFQYVYDHRHQIISANETTTPGYFTSSYGYGTGGRFTSVNVSQPSPPFGSEVKPRNVTYQYSDPDPERVTALTTPAQGTMTRYATYQYDQAGNQIWRCYGATFAPCAGESSDFLYDGKDQLRRVTKKQAGVVVGSEEYWYDDAGTRITILKRNASGTKTERIQFLGDMEVHFDQSDVKTHAYLNLSFGSPVARVKRTTGSVYEFMFHGLGNHSLAAVTMAGTVNAAFSYTPFGEVLETVDAGGLSGAATHRRRFNDKYHDAISELSYYGARYFDRTLIGWTQQDPLFSGAPDAVVHSPRRANRYQFSLSNPLSYIDFDGLNPGTAPSVEMPEDQATTVWHQIGSRMAGDNWMAHRVTNPFGDGSWGGGLKTQEQTQKCGGYSGLCEVDGAMHNDEWMSGVPNVERPEASPTKDDWDDFETVVGMVISGLAKVGRAKTMMDIMCPNCDVPRGSGCGYGNYCRDRPWDIPGRNPMDENLDALSGGVGAPGGIGGGRLGGGGRGSRGGGSRRSRGGGDCSGPNSTCAETPGAGRGRGNWDDPDNPGVRLCQDCLDRVNKAKQ